MRMLVFWMILVALCIPVGFLVGLVVAIVKRAPSPLVVMRCIGMFLMIGCVLVWLIGGIVIPPLLTAAAGILALGSLPGAADRPAAPETSVEARLRSTIALWAADDRPSWETVDALERDVERILKGDQTRSPGMPLR